MCLQLAKIPHLDILLYMLVDNICWCDGMAVNSKYTLVFFACYLECRAKGCSKSLISSLFFVIIHKLYRIWFLIIEICVTDLKVFPNGKNSLVTPKQPFTIEPPPPLFFTYLWSCFTATWVFVVIDITCQNLFISHSIILLLSHVKWFGFSKSKSLWGSY